MQALADIIQHFKTVLLTLGMWLIFNPVSPSSHVPITAGHFQVLVKGTLFERINPTEIISKPFTEATLKELQRNYPFMVGQYFELSEGAISDLNRFFHDRVWFHHEGNSDYLTQFSPHPFTLEKGAPQFENCMTFSCPWLNPKWTSKRPELKNLAQEMGSMSLSEVPSRQIFLNPRSNAYRGTVIFSKNPFDLIKQLKAGELQNDAYGKQLILGDAITDLETTH